MSHVNRYLILLSLLLLAAVGSVRAAVGVKDTVYYGGNFVWEHMGQVRNSWTNVTSDQSYQYHNNEDGKDYKLSLKCLKGRKENVAATINLNNHETYTDTRTGKTYSLPGVYLDTVYYKQPRFTDCIDTIYVLSLSGDTTSTYCKGDTYVWDRFPDLTTTSTTKTLTYQESVTVVVSGSSSSYTSKWRNYVTRREHSYSNVNVQILEGESYTWFGHTYTQSGVYYDTIPNAAGCDSIGVLQLGVCQPQTAEGRVIHVTTNDQYYWFPTNTTYTESGRYTTTLVGYCGCDSVVTLDLKIQHPALGDESVVICEGTTLQWRGREYSEAGTYVATDGSGVRLHLGVLPPPEFNVCGTKYIDAGGQANLNSTGADFYYWSPQNTLTGYYSPSPTARPTQSTTYTVTGYSAATPNIVENGDFENGNQDFTTECVWSTASNTYGKYIIAANSNNMWSNSGDHRDHTSGSGNYMVVDGFDTPNGIIWEQEIDVEPNKDYVFTAWFMSLHTSMSYDSYAKLQFFVNDQALGDVVEAPHTGNVWGRYYEQWNSGTNTHAKLTIKNQNTNKDGNDFGLDDISFQCLGECTVEKQVDVVVNRYFEQDTTIYTSQLPVIWGTQTITHEGDYTQRYFSTETGYADSVVVLHAHVLQAYPVVAHADCSADIDDRPSSDAPTMTFSLTIHGEDDCVTTSYARYREGDVVLLRAEDSACWRFLNWSDGSTERQRQITMDVDHELTAVYEKKRYTVTVHYNSAQGTVVQQ